MEVHSLKSCCILTGSSDKTWETYVAFDWAERMTYFQVKVGAKFFYAHPLVPYLSAEVALEEMYP